MAHLISKRAANRKVAHFTAVSAEGEPEGFKRHPKPLFLNFGVPNNGFFPIESLDVTLVDYPFQKSLELPVTNASLENLSLNGNGNSTNGDSKDSHGTSSNTIKLTRHVTDPKLIPLSAGLQYGPIAGLAPLVQFTHDLIERVHPPGYEEWATIITNGAGDGLNKAADALLDPEDVILIEEFTFNPFLMNVANAGGIPVPIKVDFDVSPETNGINLEYLTNLLENWETEKPGLRRPKALYTIATGQNPTGRSQSLEFRKKIYALAEKYDFAIIEDDPYGYLTLPPFKKPESILKLDQFLGVDEFVENHLVPSYVTLDTSGRVIRIETFSKLFAPGLRLGYIVAHKKVVDAIEKYATIVTRSSSGPSQTLVNNVIQQKFGGVDGWLQWILKVRHTYSHRKDLLLNSIYESKAYEKKYIDIIDPKAGMFAALILNFPEGTDVIAKLGELNWKFAQYGVNVVAGNKFAVDEEFSKDRSNFLRLTYAPANNDGEIVEAGERLTNAIYDFFENGLEY